MTHSPTHYEILGLPPNLQNVSSIPAQTLRAAYRRALLQNHPDKSPASALNTNSAEGRDKYSIDKVIQAFNVLGDKKTKANYDAESKLRGGNKTGVQGNGGQGFRTGIEVVDLDDLNYEKEGLWYTRCRCGQETGFEVREADLENAEREGEREVSVGCKGCSLWLRVLFGVVEEKEEILLKE